MEPVDTKDNELEIAEYKLLVISRFLNDVLNFSDENLIDFFRFLSPNEQYYLFDNLSEEKKLMILAKRNVLSSDVYIACCEKTNTFQNNIFLSTPYDALKRWRKEFKDEDEFGKKITLLMAILKSSNDKEKKIEDIIFREKRKKIRNQILFFCIFVFCSASFGLGAYLGGFFTGFLSFIVENGIITLGAAISLEGYTKIKESYLRESRLIKMLNWMKENDVFSKSTNVRKFSEPLTIKYAKELNKSNNKNNNANINEKILYLKQNSDIEKQFYKIGELKNKKNKFKNATKIFFYISIFLLSAAFLASLLFIPGAVALMPFLVSIFALKIAIVTLITTAILTSIVLKIFYSQVQKNQMAIIKSRTESKFNKDLSNEIFEKAKEKLSEEIPASEDKFVEENHENNV